MQNPHTSKRRKMQEIPLLGVKKKGCSIYLSSSVANLIFEFCDFAALVNVGSCNTALRRFVYDDTRSKKYFRVLDFGKIIAEWGNRITDWQLDTLLRRINARKNCEFIRLWGCLNIQGSGLAPLSGTNTLKCIDLQLVYPGDEHEHAEVDLDQVLPILESMAPFVRSGNALGLRLVKFHVNNPKESFYYERYSERIGRWLMAFHEVLGALATDLRTPCDHCKEVIAEQDPFDDMQIAMRVACCELCSRLTCSSEDCPLVESCDDCGLTCCQTRLANECEGRDVIFTCNNEDCMLGHCFDCDPGYECNVDGCQGFYCSECLDSFMGVCSYCVNDEGFCSAFCNECHVAHAKTCTRNPDNLLPQGCIM